MPCFFSPQIMQRKHVYIHFLNNTILMFNLGRVQKSLFGGTTLIFNHNFHALGDFMSLLVKKFKQLVFI